MDHSFKPGPEGRPEAVITDYISRASGLELRTVSDSEQLAIYQRIDGRSIRFNANAIEDVLLRQDSDSKDFLQVNFHNGKKILITEKLVGFKPAETDGLDLQKLPRVVTTPDLISVIEAIEETLSTGRAQIEEILVLRKVFDAVLQGAEAVGFELSAERGWLNYITNSNRKASA